MLGSLLAAVGTAQYLEAVIPVGNEPMDVLWNPASNKVYTANFEDGTVSVISGTTNQVIATIRVANGATFLCYNSVENKVYCTSNDPDWLNVIDGAGDTLIRKVRMRGIPLRMAYNRLMNKLYVVCCDDNAIRVYDGSADTLVAVVPFGINWPMTLLWHPLSNRVFVTTYCDATADTVFVIDCVTDRVVSRPAAGNVPFALVWNPVNNLVYAGTRWTVYVLSADGDSVVATIPGCGYALHSLCHVPYPNKLYAGDFNGEGVALVDCNTQSVYDTIYGVGQVYDICCDTLHGKVYIAGMMGVFVFEARTDRLIKSFNIGRNQLAWNSMNSRVYVTDDLANKVFVLRDTTTGVTEDRSVSVRRPRATATAMRGRFEVRGEGPSVLLDAQGRRVAILSPGRNDVPEMGAGVYFLCEQDGGSGCVTKVILAK